MTQQIGEAEFVRRCGTLAALLSQQAEEAASQAALANRAGMLNWDANEDTP